MPINDDPLAVRISYIFDAKYKVRYIRGAEGDCELGSIHLK
jgi:hypothetical protein